MSQHKKIITKKTLDTKISFFIMAPEKNMGVIIEEMTT